MNPHFFSLQFDKKFRILYVFLIILTFSLFWIGSPAGINTIAWCFLVVYFSLITCIDVQNQIISRISSIIGFWLGFLIGTGRNGWLDTMMGGFTGLLIMGILYYAGHYMTIVIARRNEKPVGEAIGLGDVCFAGVIGLLLGWPYILHGIIYSILFAGVYGLVVLVVQISKGQYHFGIEIPLAPFFIVSTIWLLYK